MYRYAVIFLLLLAAGCSATRDYARVQRNMDVRTTFRAGEMVSGYRYYYNGPTSEPRALLALDQRYELKSQFWHPIESNGQLRSWIAEFDRLFGEFDDVEMVMIDYKGYEILAKDNTRIGMLYSRYDWVVVWWGEGNTLYVTQPEPGGNQRAPFFFRRFDDK
jgi:hypothetical protein